MRIISRAHGSIAILFLVVFVVTPVPALAAADDPDANTEDGPSLGQDKQGQAQGRGQPAPTEAKPQNAATDSQNHERQSIQQNRAVRPERSMRHERPPRPERFHK